MTEMMQDPRAEIDQPDRVAWLRRGVRQAPEHVHYRAIYQRRTDRRPFADTPPAAEDLEQVRNAAERHGAHLHILRKEQVADLAVAVAQAGRLERNDVPVAADIAAWTNRPACTRDGVSMRTVTDGGPRTVRPRDFTGGRRPWLDYGPGTDGGTVYAASVRRSGPDVIDLP